MLKTFLISLAVAAAITVVGFAVVTILAKKSPERFIDFKGDFRYDLAVTLLFFWWVSSLVALVWLATSPARKFVETHKLKAKLAKKLADN